jgi:hypothetical protein
MGELRNKERRKRGRVYIGHRDGKQDKTVIISLSISHVTVLLLNSLRGGLFNPMTDIGSTD